MQFLKSLCVAQAPSRALLFTCRHPLPSSAPTHARSSPFGTEIPAGISLIAIKAEPGVENLAGGATLEEHPCEIWGFHLFILGSGRVPLESLCPKVGRAGASSFPRIMDLIRSLTSESNSRPIPPTAGWEQEPRNERISKIPFPALLGLKKLCLIHLLMTVASWV